MKFEVVVSARVTVVVDAPTVEKAMNISEELVELNLYPSDPLLATWAKRKRIPTITVEGVGIEGIVSAVELPADEDIGAA